MRERGREGRWEGEGTRSREDRDREEWNEGRSSCNYPRGFTEQIAVTNSITMAADVIQCLMTHVQSTPFNANCYIHRWHS